MGQARLLIGVNVFWLALSLLGDGLNTLVLPYRLFALVGEAHQATVLGLIKFVGLAAGAAVQPIVGAMSDRNRSRWSRRGVIGLGVLLALPSLALFGLAGGVIAALLGYLLVQLAAGVAQAGQQALRPDLIATNRRGIAAGLKGFMDVAGATLGFVILGQLLGGGGTAPALLAIGAPGRHDRDGAQAEIEHGAGDDHHEKPADDGAVHRPGSIVTVVSEITARA